MTFLPRKARPLTRLIVGWALLAEVVPLYPLYALLFSDTGLSGAEISALFAIWSTVGILAEVPSGAVADRFSRRGALVASGVLQAAGYLLWIVLPGFPAFAAGFVLWGLGGALMSGAQEALLYDGLVATDVVCFVLYAAWAAGGVVLVAAIWLAVTAVLPRWLGTRVRASLPGPDASIAPRTGCGADVLVRSTRPSAGGDD